MALYRCGMGGNSPYEVIEGSVTGSSGLLITVESQKGKTPKMAYIWNDTKKTSAGDKGMNVWNAPDTKRYVIYGTSSGYSDLTDSAGPNAASTYITSDNKVRFYLPTASAKYTGTWKYYVIFE